MNHREVLFEGLSEDEILSLPLEEIEGFILLGEPLIFRAGSATMLGSFRVRDRSLVIELAQIEGGGEGVLIALASLGRRCATLRCLSSDEWIVHAVSCAKPNLKLRRVLELKGYVVDDLPEIGPACHKIDRVMK